MSENSTGPADVRWVTLASEFVPESHRELPMLRVYLPFLDQANDVVRWSRYVAVEEQSASLDWFEATDRVAEKDPSVGELVSCMGQLDAITAEALRDAIGDVALRCLRWVGYGETPQGGSVTRMFGEEYVEADLGPHDVEAGRRAPEFAWDADGRLAWGARLYPDSIIVAAEKAIFRQLTNDPRLDTATVRADRDVLPPSAGD